jgi:hypothetical protein
MTPLAEIARLEPQKFKSKGEARCARVFEKFVPSWRAIEPITYEVPIGFLRAVDFRINNLLVEYHPIDLRRELLGSGTLKAIHEGLRYSPKPVKRKVMKALVDEMEHQYEKRRKQLVTSSEHEDIRQCDLVCCFSPSDVFHRVILRLNPLITHKQFNAEWGKH